MLEEELQIKEHQSLLVIMYELCGKMPDVIIFNYFDNNRYLYSLFFEAFNSIKGVCLLLGQGCLISQASTVLRMALERVVTIRVLIMNKNIMNEYIEHQKFRYDIRDEENKKLLIKKHYAGKMDSKDNKKPIEYLEYGWLKLLDKNYGLESLIKLSKIQEQDDALINWKNQLNLWVHGTIVFANLAKELKAPIIYCHSLIMIVAKLFDYLICDFKKETGFNFIFGQDDYRIKFVEAYKKIK